MRVTLKIEIDVPDEAVDATHTELIEILTAAVGAVEGRGRVDSCSYTRRD